MYGNSYHSYKITVKQMLANFHVYIYSRTGKFRQINSTFDFYCLTTTKQLIFLCTYLPFNFWYNIWLHLYSLSYTLILSKLCQIGSYIVSLLTCMKSKIFLLKCVTKYAWIDGQIHSDSIITVIKAHTCMSASMA